MSFAGILRQSTAVDVLIGPFVDSTDGDTEETGLTIAQSDVRLSKNGQTAAQKNDNTTCAHDADGFYNCELDATDTNTVGQLTLYVHVAGALAVRHDFQVVEEDVYDQLYAADAPGAPDAAGIRDAVGLASANLDTQLGAIDTVVDAILVDTAEIGAAGAGLTAVPWNAAWDAEVQSEVTDALNAYDPPTRAELTSDINSLAQYIDTEVAAILEDTGTTLPAQIAALNDLSASDIRVAIGLASANLDTQLADLPTVAEFEARTLAAGSYFDPSTDGVNVTKINGTTLTGDGSSGTPWGPA